MIHDEAVDAVLASGMGPKIELTETAPSPTEPIDISALIDQQREERFSAG